MPSGQGEPAPGVPAADSMADARAFARVACVLGLAVGVAALLGAWFPRSPEPLQSWDQATHLLLAAGYHDAWAREGFPAWHRLREVSSFYPPFYHVCVAALFPLVGLSARAAGLVGGAMLVSLALATAGIARRLHGTPADAVAAALVLHLGQGWSFQEPWGRWALDGHAVLRVALPAGVAHRATLSVTPPESLAGVQVVTVRFRERRLRSFRLDRPAWEWEDVPLEIPPGLATGGIDELSLTFSHALPAGGSDAARSLSAAVRFARFEPMP